MAMTFGGEEQETQEVHLNLTPMIDVLTTLLFFLLLSFGAVIIALINATVPVMSDSSDPAAKSDKISVGLKITDKEIELSVSSGTLKPEELDRMGQTFAKKGTEYDYKALNEYLYKLKREYPKSDTAILTPDPEIVYETIIKCMDASREYTASITKGHPRKVPLFPAAVVSTLVTDDATP